MLFIIKYEKSKIYCWTKTIIRQKFLLILRIKVLKTLHKDIYSRLSGNYSQIFQIIADKVRNIPLLLH